MMNSVLIYEAIIISLVLVFISVLISIRLAKKVGLIDIPGIAPHKQHTSPTPLAGGMALLATLFVGGFVFKSWQVPELAATLLASLIIFGFGIWDDLKNVTPPLKLFGQFLAAVVLIRLGVVVRIFESPEFFLQLPDYLAIGLDWVVTVLWMVGITNAFNFVDSMDGLAVGLGGVAAGFFVLVTLDSGQMELTVFNTLLVGICIGLYFFNAPPARLFLGDAGAQALGFFLAALAIIFQPRGINQMSSWFVTVMILGVPIFDMVMVVFSRLRRRRPIYRGARDHTYHRLRLMGLDSNRAVLLMHVVAVLLGCLAVISLEQPPLIANAIFGLVLIIQTFLLGFLERCRP